MVWSGLVLPEHNYRIVTLYSRWVALLNRVRDRKICYTDRKFVDLLKTGTLKLRWGKVGKAGGQWLLGSKQDPTGPYYPED